MIYDLSSLRNSLQRYWGYDDFRHPQGEVMTSILSGKDCLVIMPTGGGKSLCFQLPALLQQGLTLVVSPLLALMENQVRELREKNLPASVLHSELSKYDHTNTLQLLQAQKLRLLYLSPETLLSPPVWKIISQPTMKINGLILDEAHCLAQWGDTFRPAYSRLGMIRPTLESLQENRNNAPRFAIACFTATADKNTQKIITQSLKLSSPETFILNPYRDNLNITIQQVWTTKGRKEKMINYIEKNQHKSGLIYVRTRKDSQNIAEILNNLGFKNQGYHGGLDSQKRRKIETEWLEEKIKFVVCTSAFGMGINKGNLRWIFHYQAPLLLSEYIQEIGRGGRDGKPAEVVTLISEVTGWLNPEDKQRRQYFLQQQIKQYQQGEKWLKQISSEGNISNIGREKEIYLAILHRSGLLKWLDPFNYKILTKNPHQSIQQLIELQKNLTTQTQNYLTTKMCRWGFLLLAFGFSPASNFRCYHCDNCRKCDRT